MYILSNFILMVFYLFSLLFVDTRQIMKESVRRQICKIYRPRLQLSKEMEQMCYGETKLFLYAAHGFKRGMTECQTVFRKERWNCTTPSNVKIHDLFGTVLARSTKEAAVMFAMGSAGMVEYISAQLDKGKRKTDGKSHQNFCTAQQMYFKEGSFHWKEKTCDVDVKRGDDFSREVMKTWMGSQIMSNNERKMNQHNAAVGRMAVKDHMEKVCKCIGISGSCDTQCCYKKLRPLRFSINWLQNQYISAKQVRPSSRPKRDGTSDLVTYIGAQTPAKTDLIYLAGSPSYCRQNNNTMSLGTIDRICNSTSLENDNCNSLCCGRGFSNHLVEEDKYCNCKFNWCCEVKCDKCRRKRTYQKCR